jgi:hypothetical protein
VNPAGVEADTSNVQRSSDSYFVRLDVVDTATRPALVDRNRHAYDDHAQAAPKVKRRHRRKHHHLRPGVLLLLAIAAWCGWASQRPGGISGTINGWIEHVRGDVAKISADPDFTRAVNYYNVQFSANRAYPQLTDDQLAADGGIGIRAEWCSTNAVVLQGAEGGGTASRLLLNGRDLGVVMGKHDCPGDLTDPQPWKL